MATIKRSDVIQKAVNDLAINSSMDKIPSETLDKVQLTYNLNKETSQFIVTGSSTSTAAAAGTLPVVSAGGETYITSLNASLIKDATCDTATAALGVSVIPFATNVTKILGNFTVISLTAQNQSFTITLSHPLRVVNNSLVNFAGTFSVGVMVKAFSIIGFTTSSN